MVFKLIFLNLLYDPDLWSWDFKVEFVLLVGPISRVLVVLQKANNVVVRCHFSEMPFMLGAIFVRWYF